MREPRARLIVPELPSPGEPLRLSGEEAQHARARRLARGDLAVLLDGSGRTAVARVTAARLGSFDLLVEELHAAEEEPAPLALGIASVRAERLAWAVEKATELGATAVTLLTTARTQAFRASRDLSPRLERVAREAVTQCGRVRWPSIQGPLPLADWLESETSPTRFFLDSPARAFPRVIEPGGVALAIGPEGGWSEGERDLARSRHWLFAALPAGTLRAETAAVASLALALAARASGGR